MVVKILSNIPFVEYEELLPSKRFRWICHYRESINQLVTFVAVDEDDEDKKIGYCIYCTHKSTEKYAVLIYLRILDEYQGQGIGKQLMDESTSEIRYLGYSKSMITLMEGDEPDFFVNNGFKLLRNEIYMNYSGKTIRTSKIWDNIGTLKPYLKKVRRAEEISPTTRKTFRKHILEKIYGVDIDKVDEALSRFYVDDKGEILSFMSFRKNHIGHYFLTYFYMSHTKEATISIPSIIVSLLTSKSLNITDEKKLLLTFASFDNVAAMEQGFGMPTEKTVVRLYMT